MSDVKILFGKNLKRLRTDCNLTQEELSEKVNLQPQSISNIESGRYFISPENFEVLCDFFNVNPLEFFLDFNKEKSLSDKEKLNVINSIISNIDSELIDYFYKMFLAIR